MKKNKAYIAPTARVLSAEPAALLATSLETTDYKDKTEEEDVVFETRRGWNSADWSEE